MGHLPGVTLPASLPDLVRGWNVVDVLLAVFLLLSAVGGMRRGFIANVLGLAGFLAALYVAFRTFPFAAGLIRQYVALPDAAANVAGFLAALVVAQIVFAVASRLLLLALQPVRALLGPLALLDNVLGVVPGVVQGALLATLVITPLRALSVPGPVGQAVEGSRIAALLTQAGARVAPPLSGLVNDVVGDVIGEAPLFGARIIGAEESVRIIPQQQMRLDAQAEAEMLALVNKERAAQGMPPLVVDDVLRRVARAHSEEMLRLGYFSHTSPTPSAHTPADRLYKENYRFTASGENLAFAPTVDAAHAGLMASPGHRANILSAQYTRVGIGVQDAGPYGRMFTQEFAG